MLNQYAAPIALTGLTLTAAVPPAIAAPADLFMPYLEQIHSCLPPGLEMRLPADVALDDAIPLDTEELIVRVFSAASPPRLTISLFTCESNPFPCLVGSFSVEAAASANAQRELDRHRSMRQAIALAPGIQGYYLEGASLSPGSEFASLMWQQNGMIYVVNFQAHERDNILEMAASMTRESPIQPDR